MYPKLIKPILDFVAALMALLLLSPVFLMVWVLLTLANQGNPFFIQPRPGKNGKVFNIIKFKTMNDRKDIYGNLLPDADRLTPVGAFVRKTSLDELPQLLNVIKGDMSFVGPRPLLVQYLPLYNEFQKKRHEVKPGITGWAQVNGRNAISWDKKFELDVWYVNNINFVTDIKIIYMTALKVLKSEGINETGQATTTEFKGN